MSGQEKNNWHNVEWPRILLLELFGDGVTAASASAHTNQYWINGRFSQWTSMEKCMRWYRRVDRFRSTRQRIAQAQIEVMLERAALGLLAPLDNNNDMLGKVLKLAHTTLCVENGLNPHTLLPMPHM